MTTEQVEQKIAKCFRELAQLEEEMRPIQLRRDQLVLWRRIDRLKAQIQEYRRWLDWEVAAPRSRDQS